MARALIDRRVAERLLAERVEQIQSATAVAVFRNFGEPLPTQEEAVIGGTSRPIVRMVAVDIEERGSAGLDGGPDLRHFTAQIDLFVSEEIVRTSDHFTLATIASAVIALCEASVISGGGHTVQCEEHQFNRGGPDESGVYQTGSVTVTGWVTRAAGTSLENIE